MDVDAGRSDSMEQRRKLSRVTSFMAGISLEGGEDESLFQPLLG